MIMDTIPLDTQTSAPVYIQYGADRPKTERLVAQLPIQREPTQVLANLSIFESSSTATVAEVIKQKPSKFVKSSDLAQPPLKSVLEKTRHDRVHLLAVKYGGKLDIEGKARLDILTSRMEKLNPRINDSHMRALESMHANVNQIGDDISNLRAQFNI